MPDASQGFSPSAASQETTPKKVKQEEKNTCLPVTIRAIEASVKLAAGGPVRFFGTEQGILIVVGVVDAIVRQPASIEFTLNDATGRIRVRHFLMAGKLPKGLEGLAPGCYISAFGNVRMEPMMHFAASGLRLVESADEVSYHMIESTYAALKIRKARGELPATPQRPVPAAQAVLEPSTAIQLTPQKVSRLEGEGLRSSILEFVRKAGGTGVGHEGTSFTAVCQHIAGVPQGEVSAMLQKLLDDGEIFTTVDDLHYQCV